MKMNPNPLEIHAEELAELCHEYQVERLFAFGSALTERFDPARSDLDFIVELRPMPPLDAGETFMALWEELEFLFQRPVDLLTDQQIQNPYLRANIEKSKSLIYDRRSEEVLV